MEGIEGSNVWDLAKLRQERSRTDHANDETAHEETSHQDSSLLKFNKRGTYADAVQKQRDTRNTSTEGSPAQTAPKDVPAPAPVPHEAQVLNFPSYRVSPPQPTHEMTPVITPDFKQKAAPPSPKNVRDLLNEQADARKHAMESGRRKWFRLLQFVLPSTQSHPEKNAVVGGDAVDNVEKFPGEHIRRSPELVKSMQAGEALLFDMETMKKIPIADLSNKASSFIGHMNSLPTEEEARAKERAVGGSLADLARTLDDLPPASAPATDEQRQVARAYLIKLHLIDEALRYS